jgi:hypothetical protein
MRRTYFISLLLLGGACHVVNDLDGYQFVDPQGGAAGLGGGGQGGDGVVTFAVRANVVRLSTTITLELNEEETLTVTDDGTYAWEMRVADGAPYEVTFTDPFGEHCVADDPTGEVAGADVVVTITCTPTVRARFDAGQEWLDYVTLDGMAACMPDVVARPADCLHGGERRAVYVPWVESCGDKVRIDVVGSDTLAAFTWSCEDDGEYVELVSALETEHGLTDLVDFTTVKFRSNAVTIETPEGMVTTDSSVWWGNEVVAVDATTALDSPGTIYLLAANPAVAQAVTPVADQVALVVSDDVVVTAAPFSAANLDFVWVEGAFEGGATLDGTRMSVLRGVTFGDDVVLTDNHALFVHGIDIHDGDICLDASENFGLAIEFARIHTCTERPALFVHNTGGYLHETTAANSGAAIVVHQAVGFAMDQVTITSITAGSGLNVTAASNGVHATRITTSSTEDEGIRFECTPCSLRGATAALARQNGFYLRAVPAGGETPSYIADILAADNEVGISAEDLEANARNWISLGNRSAGTPIDILVTDSTLDITGVVKVDTMGTRCSVTASTGITDTTCAPGGTSTFVLTPDAAPGNVFMEKFTGEELANDSDSAGGAAFASISDWVKFTRRQRGWGIEGGTFPALDNQGPCATGQCRIWDWSLKGPFLIARNQNGEPNGDLVATVGSDTFLVGALEYLGDGVGDDDTLCETEEACLWMRNVGAYQGHVPDGETMVDIDNFMDGAFVTGVELERYPATGY